MRFFAGASGHAWVHIVQGQHAGVETGPHWLATFPSDAICMLACGTQIKRTEGVSTTDIVGRMLTCTRVNKFISNEQVGLGKGAEGKK